MLTNALTNVQPCSISSSWYNNIREKEGGTLPDWEKKYANLIIHKGHDHLC